MKLKKIAIGVALASSTMAAQAADVLFFPYVVSGGSVTTLVSVLNKANAGDPVKYYNGNGTNFGTYTPDTRFLHWSFGVKTADTAGAICEDRNGFFPTSPLDLVTYDVSTLRGNRGVMFEDPASISNVATGKNAFGSLPLESGKRATLFVANAATGDLTDPTRPSIGQPFLSGDAIILEFATGAAWGYEALVRHNIISDPNLPVDPVIPGNHLLASYDFSSIQPLNTDISFGPQNEVTTRFFVTPVNPTPLVPGPPPTGSSMLVSLGEVVGVLSTRVHLERPLGVGSPFTVYDRDESGFSSTEVNVSVVCTFPVDLVQHGNIPGLINSPVVLPYVMEQGGWSRIRTFGESSDGHAVVNRLDFRPAGGNGNNQFGMPEGTGAFNTSFTLNPSAALVP